MTNLLRGLVRALILGVTLLLPALPAQAGPTLDAVKARGQLLCGANILPGYAAPDAEGHWSGIMVDLCRAIAAVSLGEPSRYEIIPVESQSRFTALSSGAIDVLVDGATVTLEREVKLGLTFPAIWLYDGQTFLAHRALGLKSLRQAKGASICVADGTTSKRNAEDYIRREKLNAKILATQTDQGAWQSYLKGRCGIITSDRFGLLSRMILDAQNPTDHDLLPEVISKEPIGPTVRSDDEQWTKLVRWTVYALIAAEEHGLTSANIAQPPDSSGIEMDVLTGRGPDYADSLGVAPGWARRAIGQVGNYGEIFARHFGAASPIKSERGLNAPWSQGGLLYAPPLR